MKEVNWENIILVDEDDNDIDYYIVINRPKFKSRIIPSNKILFFHMEPNMQFTSWYQEFLNKFSSEDLLFNGKHLYHRNNIGQLSFEDFFGEHKGDYNDVVMNIQFSSISDEDAGDFICKDGDFYNDSACSTCPAGSFITGGLPSIKCFKR